MAITSINPATNITLQTFARFTKDETLDSIAKARQAYQSWWKQTFGDRKQIISKFSKQLGGRSDEFARLITLDMGKRISESRRELEYCDEIAEFYGGGAERFLADEPIQDVDAQAYIHYEPLGVLMGVMPWNFPFYQVTRFAAPNIMAGNTSETIT